MTKKLGKLGKTWENYDRGQEGCQIKNKAEIPQWSSPESGDVTWTKSLLVSHFSCICVHHMKNAFVSGIETWKTTFYLGARLVSSKQLSD